MKSFNELPDFRDLRKLWKQEPVTPPTSDLELTPDSWVERGAEVIGWHLSRCEYWLSNSGWLRAWFRLNLFLSIVLTTAGVLLLPPVTYVLEQLATSSHWFASIFGDLMGLISRVPPAIISVAFVYLIFIGIKQFRNFRRRRIRSGNHSSEDGYFQ